MRRYCDSWAGFASGTGIYLFRRFEAIRNAPANHRDYQTRDETGRELDSHIANRFAIHFWDDMADRHLKIMRVTWADRVE